MSKEAYAGLLVIAGFAILAVVYAASPGFGIGTAVITLLILLGNRWNLLERDFQIGGAKF